MGSQGRSVGRNARKKGIRRLRENTHLEFFSGCGEPRKVVDWEANPPTDGQLLSHLQSLFMAEHRRQLHRCAMFLGAPGCWEWYKKHLPHAKIFHYETELRSETVRAAALSFSVVSKPLHK